MACEPCIRMLAVYVYTCCTVSPGRFSRVTKYAKISKYETFFYLRQLFVLFKKFLIANDTRYNLCVLNILQVKGSRKSNN